jgi:carbon storage regulator
MLYLSRKLGESIIVNNNIKITVVEVRGRAVKLGITYPPEASVLREELFLKISEQNLAASKNQWLGDGDEIVQNGE